MAGSGSSGLGQTKILIMDIQVITGKRDLFQGLQLLESKEVSLEKKIFFLRREICRRPLHYGCFAILNNLHAPKSRVGTLGRNLHL